MPAVNNPIRSQNILTKLCLMSPCSRQGAGKQGVYGERQPSHDLMWIWSQTLRWKLIIGGSCFVKLLVG